MTLTARFHLPRIDIAKRRHFMPKLQHPRHMTLNLPAHAHEANPQLLSASRLTSDHGRTQGAEQARLQEPAAGK
jgi:hypothetical protein